MRILVTSPEGRLFNKSRYIPAAEIYHLAPTEDYYTRLCTMDISEIFFRKFKYTSVFSLRNSGSCAVIKNIPKGNEVLAVHELVVVTVCHFGGSRYVLQIHSVATFS